MIETLNNIDTQLFYFLNGLHCTGMDWVMWVFTARWSWLIIIVAAYLLLTTRTFHLSPFTFHLEKHWWLVLLGIGLCFLLADRGSVMLFKNTVCRERPCHTLENVHMFREGCGGLYGFISSHAANAFAIAFFFWKRYRRQTAKVLVSTIVPIAMIVWAFMTSYSRVYLGKHYPGDILCGAIFGVLVGWLVWWITKKIEELFQKNETK